MTRPTRTEVLAALDEMTEKMLATAEIIARRYGRQAENASQLAQAALIARGWMPAIEQEAE